MRKQAAFMVKSTVCIKHIPLANVRGVQRKGVALCVVSGPQAALPGPAAVTDYG
jgi:hypothetical protein